MLQTALLLEQRLQEARQIDRMLIDNGRKRIVRENMSQLTGMSRSDRFIERTAGISSDVPRASATEKWLRWYGSAAIEDAEKSALVAEFLGPLFTYAKAAPVFARPFFELDEELNALESRMRRAYVEGNAVETRHFIVQAKMKLDQLLQCVNAMEGK